MGARCQTLAHKQRMPTSQGGSDKHAFCAPYDGHFIVVNDSVVAGSHLTKSVTYEVSPISAQQEAIRETNHGDIDPLGGDVVSSKHTQFLEGINFPFHKKDSTLSVNIAHLNFRASVDRYRCCRYCSKCSCLAKVCK